ncbi:MAG: aspartate aminotransferase family protein [Planctomycetota bacterium]|nr:MAG: aspartate aminotransferase family protein [Planctomycetota bacterium]
MSDAVQRSLRAFPAGCNGEFNLPPDLAKVIVRGAGCELWTADGQRMLDFSIGWGSVLPGHARPEVVAAVERQLRRGTNFSYVTDQSLALAEELIAASPACQQVRFCASGTEATMYCLRLARAYTGRPKVLKFEGAYHGAHDVGVSSLFPVDPPDFPQAVSSSAGVEPGAETSTLVAPFNDLAATRDILVSYGDQVAGVIVEPLQRCLPPARGFLEGLRAATRACGSLLIFDEVVTGFRLAYGGAQEYYGVVPDLVAYGKALGGGMPIGAFGGRREIMDLVREDRFGQGDYVWTASTLGGNPVSATAARAALAVYRENGAYQRLRRLGELLRSGMRRKLAQHGLAATVLGDGPLAQVVFTEGVPRDYRSSRHAAPELARRLMLELFRRGVFLNPMGTKLYLSLAHTEAACEEFCEAFNAALGAVCEQPLPLERTQA